MNVQWIMFIFFWGMAGVMTSAAAEDKNRYHLFNPVPKELMREISTDRPDQTESAYTVDAGHYQLEMTFFDYTYDRHNPTGAVSDADALSIAPVNLKVGLLNNADLQLLFDPYISEKTVETSRVERRRGVGDLQTRLKINLWGNDGGTTALALMPFVKFPTNSDGLGNDEVEGGLIVPLAVALPGAWGMGLMTEFDFNEDVENAGDLRTDFINSVTFAHPIAGDLNGYVEFFSKITEGFKSDWIGMVDAGLTYGLTEDIQLDAGINVGVTRAADDFNPFCGLSVRY